MPHRHVGLEHVPGAGISVAVDRDRADAQARNVRMTRTAISPRLATRTRVSNDAECSSHIRKTP